LAASALLASSSASFLSQFTSVDDDEDVVDGMITETDFNEEAVDEDGLQGKRMER
jgi:hypothetical protein